MSAGASSEGCFTKGSDAGGHPLTGTPGRRCLTSTVCTDDQHPRWKCCDMAPQSWPDRPRGPIASCLTPHSNLSQRCESGGASTSIPRRPGIDPAAGQRSRGNVPQPEANPPRAGAVKPLEAPTHESASTRPFCRQTILSVLDRPPSTGLARAGNTSVWEYVCFCGLHPLVVQPVGAAVC